MPIVRIDIQAGKSTEYKRALLHGVRSAITEALGVPDDRITQRITETPAEDIDTTEIRSDRLTVVEIAMLPRTTELKETLYRAVAKYLGQEPGISGHDLIVLVNDPAAECFFLNGQMQCSAPAGPVTAAPAPAEPLQDEPAENPEPAEESE